MPKLTLNADSDVIRKAKDLAHERGTSVSAMFSQIIRSAASPGRSDKMPLAPLTRRVAGMAKLPAGKTYRQLIEESIMEKHGR